MCKLGFSVPNKHCRDYQYIYIYFQAVLLKEVTVWINITAFLKHCNARAKVCEYNTSKHLGNNLIVSLFQLCSGEKFL